MFHFQVQTSIKSRERHILTIFYAIANKFLLIGKSQNKMTKVFHGHPLRPEKLNKFFLWEKLVHFQVQTSHKEEKDRFNKFSCAIAQAFFIYKI